MKPNYQTIPQLNITGRFNTQDEFEKIGLPEDLSHCDVLDIGCNEGAFMIECLKRGSNSVCGIDIDEEWVSRARAAVSKLIPDWLDRAFFYVDDAVDLLSKEHGPTVQLILCLSVTHLIDRPNKLVELCMKHLMPGGLLILEINHRLEKEKVILPEGAIKFGENKDGRTVYHITKDNL